MKVPIAGTSFEERAAIIAGRQRGRVSRAQLLAVRVSSTSIARLVASGYLWPEHPGVYAVGHRAPIAGAGEAAGLLSVRPGGHLSHATVLRWWGLAHVDDGDRISAPIHVTVPGTGTSAPDGVVVHRSTILTSRDLRRRDGLPVLSVARALLDLAAEKPGRPLERAYDESLARHLVRAAEIRELLARAGRHPGRATLAELAEHAVSGSTFTRSEAEERFLALIRAAGLPVPRINAHHLGYEIDFLWLDHGLAVEIDGFAFHADRASFERDRRRDAALAAAGITVIRITWRRLVAEPLAVVAEVAAALAQRVAR